MTSASCTDFLPACSAYASSALNESTQKCSDLQATKRSKQPNLLKMGKISFIVKISIPFYFGSLFQGTKNKLFARAPALRHENRKEYMYVFVFFLIIVQSVYFKDFGINIEFSKILIISIQRERSKKVKNPHLLFLFRRQKLFTLLHFSPLAV